MFSRPTSRTRRTKGAQIELNLVPILDSLVTLICFLMLTMSFLSIVSIESPFPTVSEEDLTRKLQDPKERPLQLTVSMRENELEVWSPFDRIQARKIPYKAEGQPDTQALHDTMIEIKQQFPNEYSVVIVPTAKTDYESLIVLMDAIRTLEKTDTPIYRRNPETGNDEPVTTLFPDVVFGNLLGES